VKRRYYPAVKRLSVIESLSHDSDDESIYPTLVRRDILENQTSALPFRNIIGMRSNDGYLVRTLDDHEIFTSPLVVDALVEDQFWGRNQGR
jgi:hypothetical protein